jgi:uncharacterized protein (DUF849 family)
VLIKAAINGGRSRAEHTAVPVSPEEQAAAVVECLKAGANAIHLHVRSTSISRDENSTSVAGDESLQSERESLDAEDVARTLLAVRSVSPNAQIGVSTGAWILPNPTARFEAVAAWEGLPGFASVNFNEAGAVELARLLLSRGVDVEAGLCDADAAAVFLKSGLAVLHTIPTFPMGSPRCTRVLLEPQDQEIERALETVRAIEKVLSFRVEVPYVPLLLHGTEATVWPMMDEAIACGYDVRIGLEDTLVLPDGRMARDNAELVTEAVRRVRAETVGSER